MSPLSLPSLILGPADLSNLGVVFGGLLGYAHGFGIRGAGDL